MSFELLHFIPLNRKISCSFSCRFFDTLQWSLILKLLLLRLGCGNVGLRSIRVNLFKERRRKLAYKYWYTPPPLYQIYVVKVTVNNRFLFPIFQSLTMYYLIQISLTCSWNLCCKIKVSALHIILKRSWNFKYQFIFHFIL